MLAILNVSFGQVTVTTENLKVNGVAASSVNFNASSSLAFTVDVNLKTFDGSTNNIFGNLYLYYKPSATTPEVQIGIWVITFVVTYPPFVTQTTYTNQSSFAPITLSASNFFPTGGIIYARYVNNNNSSYTSSNISITGGTRVATSPPPSTGNTICCNQTIRYGDKPVITGSTITTLPPGVTLHWAKGSGFGGAAQTNHATSDGWNNFDPDYMFQTTTYKRVLVSSTSTKSNDITVTVVPTPIASNTIMCNGSKLSDGIYESGELESLDFSGLGANFNLNVLADPFHSPVRADSYESVSEYQWQYRSGYANSRWQDITNVTGFVQPAGYPDNFFIRRIAKHQNIRNVSNILQVYIRKASVSNTICCDQALAINQVPAAVTGTAAVYSTADGGKTNTPTNITIKYQWQSRFRSSPWTNIVGANSQNYAAPAITSPNISVSYRRIARVDYYRPSEISGNPTASFYETYSNVISLETAGGTRTKISMVHQDSQFTIFPNPTSSILNISVTNGLESTSFKTFNALGQDIKLNFIKLDDNVISVDVSVLTKGVYYILLEIDSKIIVKKFIKE
ncbi:MAG: T9SS type A sorting domain-containing protein [Flavobacterium sp.]